MAKTWGITIQEQEKDAFGSFLTDSLVASVGCFGDESLVEQTEAGERSFDRSHLSLRVDIALG